MHGVCGAIFSGVDIRDYKMVLLQEISEIEDKIKELKR